MGLVIAMGVRSSWLLSFFIMWPNWISVPMYIFAFALSSVDTLSLTLYIYLPICYSIKYIQLTPGLPIHPDALDVTLPLPWHRHRRHVRHCSGSLCFLRCSAFEYYSCVVLWHMMAIISVWMWILIKHNLIGPFDQASVFSWQKYILYSMVKQWQRQNGTKGQVLKPVFSKSRASFHQESVHPSESSVHNLSQFNSQHHSILRTCSVGPISPK